MSQPVASPPTPIGHWEVLDLLASLVQKSLVLYEEDPHGNGRYRLLETVRQYAQDRLQETGEAPAVREQHRDWFLALAEAAGEGLLGESQSAWLDRLEREHDNLRAALAWCVKAVDSGQWTVDSPAGTGSKADPPLSELPPPAARVPAHCPLSTAVEAGLRLGGALQPFWQRRGYLKEGREHLAGLLALPEAQARTAARATLLGGAGWLAGSEGDFGAARAAWEESLAIFRELGDEEGIAWSLSHLGWAIRVQGDLGAARAPLEKSLAIFRELGHPYGIACSLNQLGDFARDQGDLDEARALFEESLALFRALGNKDIGWSLTGLAAVVRDQGDDEGARALFEESLLLFRDQGDKAGIAKNLEGLAAMALAQGHLRRAACLFGAAEGLRETKGAPLPPAERAEHDHSLAALRAALGEAVFAAAWTAGRAMPTDDAVAFALAAKDDSRWSQRRQPGCV